MVDLVIRGGTVVTPGGIVVADIALENGVIAEVAGPGTLPTAGATVIDANGKWVLPGLIDLHVAAAGHVATNMFIDGLKPLRRESDPFGQRLLLPQVCS